jgi:hypothetical protein
MNEANTTVVFHGFLQLSAKEKLKLVEKINEYFDSNERESIRAAAEAEFIAINGAREDLACPCCGR